MLAAVALLALSAEPEAKGLSATAVFVFAEDTLAERMAGKIEVDLADRLAKKNLKLVDLGAAFPAPKQSSAEGDALIKEGKEAYDNLDLDTAIQKLTDAALFFIKHPELTDPKKLAEVFVYLGAAEQQNSVKTYAKEFARAIKLNPTFEPDPKFFGADVTKAYAQVRAELDTRGKATVRFESIPSGAQLELNGKPMGMSPLNPVELAVGRHFIRASRPGYQSAAKFPEVTQGDEIEVRLDLTPAPTYAPVLDQAKKLAGRAAFDTQKLPPGAAPLGQAVNARFVVLATVVTLKGSTKVEAQVWDVVSGDRLRELKFDADEFSMSNAADTIARWIERPSPVAIAEAQGSGSSSVITKPWFWAAAVGVVAVGAAVSVGVVAGQRHHRFDFITGIP